MFGALKFVVKFVPSHRRQHIDADERGQPEHHDQSAAAVTEASERAERHRSQPRQMGGGVTTEWSGSLTILDRVTSTELTSAAETAQPDELVVLVVRTAKALVERLRAERPGGAQSPMTVVHGLATRYLLGRDDVTAGELARYLKITKQSTSEVVAQLEQAGIVHRAPHPRDGRARVLRLTDEGTKKLDAGRVAGRTRRRMGRARRPRHPRRHAPRARRLSRRGPLRHEYERRERRGDEPDSSLVRTARLVYRSWTSGTHYRARWTATEAYT